MFELFKSAVLGIVQGLTEFLPVSSSGHLEIAKYLMSDQRVGQQSLMMTVVLHFATALSTIVIFRREITKILLGLFKFQDNEELLFCLKIGVSLIPAAIIGILFKEQIESLFDKQLVIIGLTLFVTGILLMLADRAKTTDKSVGFFNAFLIGVSQAIAILPGLSRSGATISTSVMLGIDREKAARFSFLMVVPLIFGSIAKDLLDAWREGKPFVESSEALPLMVGFMAAFLTGLFACSWMIKLVKSSKLSYFSIYCFVVATLVLAESYFRFLAPAAA
jgi:undecaprenyl-diphosphatase